jgi:hypothetical protein
MATKEKKKKQPEMLRQLRMVTVEFDNWCDDFWPVALDADLDEGVEKVKVAFAFLRKATKSHLREEKIEKRAKKVASARE